MAQVSGFTGEWINKMRRFITIIVTCRLQIAERSGPSSSFFSEPFIGLLLLLSSSSAPQEFASPSLRDRDSYHQPLMRFNGNQMANSARLLANILASPRLWPSWHCIGYIKVLQYGQRGTSREEPTENIRFEPTHKGTCTNSRE